MHRLVIPAGEVIAIAGLWDKWRDRSGESSETFTIIMANRNEPSKTVQVRVPVIIEREDFDAWLREPRTDLLKPFAGEIVVE